MTLRSGPVLRHAARTLLGCALSLAVVLGGLVATADRAQAAPAVDPVAQTYYEVLLRHTPVAESKWDAANERYTPDSYFGESLVLGNAVLLTRGTYDESLAGVSKATLLDHTLKSITYFAATNRFNGGTLWGKNLFWDATYESYFLAAAHLLWDQLDATTQANVLNISKGQADYTVGLGSADDPGSGGWSPNGLAGGYKGDSKIEEMGVYALGIAPALAYNTDDANAAGWNQWLGTWVRNMTSLPVADKNNPTTLGGVPVSSNTAQNLYPGYLVENHDAFAPHYQQELWRTMARSSVHFLLKGVELPAVLRQQVNGDEILATILQDTSDSGEPFMVMNQDREFLYGRDVIPLAYLAQVQGNKYVARAEADLAANLLAFQAYGNSPRIAFKTIGAQTSGEEKYEGEARSEIAIAYLLHEWRNQSASGPVEIASEAQLFAHAAGATDYGASRPGLIMHQSENAWAASVDRAGYVKFAWQPEHDDWLFDVAGATPYFLPTNTPTVSSRFGEAYNKTADGFTGSASLLDVGTGRAGMTTLPTGTVVYSTSGTRSNEGPVSVRNIDMGSVRGLDGDRTYTTAEGPTTFTNKPPASPADCTKPAAASRRDCLSFEPVSARYLRVQGINRTSNGNYSLREVQALDGANGTNLITPAMEATEKNSGGVADLPAAAIDSDIATYWKSAGPGGSLSDADWWQVDLGASTRLDRVILDWGTQPASAFAVQVSADGSNWQSVSFYGVPASVSVFPRTQARYVRYQGVAPHAQYGYSIREIEVRDGDDGPDLAQEPEVVASASSWGSTLSPQRPISAALDKNFGTWWSVAQTERSRADSWYQLDLGSLRSLDRVVVFQELTPVAYEIQISADGETWQTVDLQAPGAARVDNDVFDGGPVSARYVRMQGVMGHSQYGYSVHEFQVFNGDSGANVAIGATPTASSADGANPVAGVNDNKFNTRWAVAVDQRGQGDSWVQLDLGSAQTIDRARLVWNTAAGVAYYLQTSLDGVHWTNQYGYGTDSFVSTSDGWLTVDDRASFVVNGSKSPITVVPGGTASVDRITLSTGSAADAAGMVVEGYVKTDAVKAAQLAARPRAAADASDVTVSDADGYLSLFNLGATDATTTVSLPRSGELRLYQGTQTVGADSSTLEVAVPASSSRVLPPLFTATGDTDRLVVEVVNGRRVTLTAESAGTITLVPRTGDPLDVELGVGSQTVEFPETTRPYPLADVAAGKLAYPSSPLPQGMTDPDLALDDDVSTVWVPGSVSGRMVVDLGAPTDLGMARVVWDGRSAPGAVLYGSADGIAFTELGPVAAGTVSETTLTGQRARYLALQVEGWSPSEASVATFAVFAGSADPAQVADELQVPEGALDKSALQAAELTASVLVEADYTTSSWTAAGLASVLAEARAVLAGGSATQAEVDKATTALNDAMALLARRGDPGVLSALIQAADALSAKLDGFTDATAGALREALRSAKTAYGDRADKTQAQLDTAVSGLQTALSGLVAKPPVEDKPPVVDKAVLQSVYNGAKKLSNPDGRYTAASWSTLQAELAGAEKVLGNASATQAQVNAAVGSLASAISGLVPVQKSAAPVVAKVKLNQGQLRLVKGKSLKLEEGVYYAAGLHSAYSARVTWKSSNPKVATVSGNGVVKARKTGTVTITATTTQLNAAGRKLSASVKVTVVAKKPKAKVTKVSASVPKSMKLGQSVYITGKYSSSKATGVKVTYKTSKRTVADVDPVGRIIGKGKGTAKITVEAGGKSKTYKVTVK